MISISRISVVWGSSLKILVMLRVFQMDFGSELRISKSYLQFVSEFTGAPGVVVKCRYYLCKPFRYIVDTLGHLIAC